MKATFYGQFVAGEDQEAIKPLLRRNQAFGVGAVLDYGVEKDLSPEAAERQELASCTSAAEKEMGGAEQREKQYRAHRGFGDRRDGVISAHTYFYADEAKCDQHMEAFLHCIDASSGSSENGFSAIKLSALGRPQFLLQFSEVLVKWRRFFHQMAAEQGQAGRAVLEMKLEAEKLQEALANLGIATKAESQHWFTGENLGMSGTVDLLDWNSLIDSRTKLSKLLLVPNMQTGQLEPLLSRFTEEEDLQMKRMLQRMDVLAKRATEKGVRLMVDAEQSYFQPAISRLTLEMQRRFNRDQANIFNTYQCYLKEAYDNVTVDVELSRREGWCFGTKLVRGAYMEQERERAAQIGCEDPINPTYEKTNEMYHRCLDYILEEIKHSRKASVMVASHNEDTVKFTLRRSGRLPCLQVRALRPLERGAALPVPEGPGEQGLHAAGEPGAGPPLEGGQEATPRRHPLWPQPLTPSTASSLGTPVPLPITTIAIPPPSSAAVPPLPPHPSQHPPHWEGSCPCCCLSHPHCRVAPASAALRDCPSASPGTPELRLPWAASGEVRGLPCQPHPASVNAVPGFSVAGLQGEIWSPALCHGLRSRAARVA
ncbi:proline dehydrogenase 1, mitochondrial isoform X2 [Athene noctua]|uniref:proline dehydrogenase 1, mitochondrial isoform X2 n=1 Tax=Athene noctua TaxID=126797 RepID=UPI003EBD1BF9